MNLQMGQSLVVLSSGELPTYLSLDDEVSQVGLASVAKMETQLISIS